MGTYKEISLEHWSELHNAREELTQCLKKTEDANGRHLNEPLFRGLGNHEWKLETTLERSPDVRSTETLISYYRRAARSKPAVVSITGRLLDGIPDYPTFEASLQDPTSESIDQTLGINPAIYSYLVYPSAS